MTKNNGCLQILIEKRKQHPWECELGFFNPGVTGHGLNGSLGSRGGKARITSVGNAKRTIQISHIGTRNQTPNGRNNELVQKSLQIW